MRRSPTGTSPGTTLTDACRVVEELNAHQEAGDDRRARRGDHARRRGACDRPHLRGRLPHDRRARARREREREADGARPEPRLRHLPRQRRARRPAGRGDRQLRPHRHGGLVDDGRHAPRLPRAARGRARERRRRAPGVPAADGRRHPRRWPTSGSNIRLCKGIYVEPGRDRLHRLRGDPRELRARASRRCSTSGAYVGIATHDDWLVAEAAAHRPPARARAGRVRVPDAARRAARPGRPARRRGPPAAHLRAVRQPLVRVLDAAARRRTRSSPATSPSTRSAG